MGSASDLDAKRVEKYFQSVEGQKPFGDAITPPYPTGNESFVPTWEQELNTETEQQNDVKR